MQKEEEEEVKEKNRKDVNILYNCQGYFMVKYFFFLSYLYVNQNFRVNVNAIINRWMRHTKTHASSSQISRAIASNDHYS